MKKNQIAKKAFTLVELMVIVAIIIILTTIAIPNIIKAKMSANDVIAQATLKTIGKAMETYLITTSSYPTDPSQLTSAVPPYLNDDYFTGTRNGFTYAPGVMDGSSYAITATPVIVGQTGTTVYTVTTGGELQ